MAKRKRSAKQLANDRRLRAKAKAGTLFKKKRSKTKRKSTSKRRTVRRVITKIRRRKTMVKRRSAPRRKSSFKVPFLSNPMVKKVAAGVGMGTVLTTVLTAVGQPALANNPAVKIIGGFAGGDVIGAASAFLLGGGGSLLGGGSSASMEGLA